MSVVNGAEDLGIRVGAVAGPAQCGAVSGRAAAARAGRSHASVDAPRLYARVKALAQAQSADVAKRLAAEGVQTITGRGGLGGPDTVIVDGQRIQADAVLIATGRDAPGAARRGARW